MNKNPIIYLVLLMISFHACKKETLTPVADQSILKTLNVCNSFEFFEAALDAVYNENNLVSNFRIIDNDFEIDFFNGQQILICDEIFNSFLKIDSTSQLIISFEEGQEKTLLCFGNVETLVELNPSGYCPLCLHINISSNITSRKIIELLPKPGEESEVIIELNDLQKTHQTDLIGLYADHENKIVYHILSADDLPVYTDTIKVITSALPKDFPEVSILISDPANMEEGFTLVSYLGSWPNIPFMFDAFGNVRWYLDYTEHELLNSLFYDVGIERLQNGNFYFGDILSNKYYEIDLTGDLINSWEIPSGYSFHHNIQEKPDGNFLITVNKFGDLHQNINFTVEDHIIEVDRNSGTIIHEWDLKDHLDEWRTDLVDNLNNEYIDWVHVNAVVYDASDHSIIISGRHQAVAKIGYDDELKWILGPQQGWGTNRKGQNCADFLLDPVDASDNSLSEEVKQGYENHNDFEWNWFQHAVMLKPNGNIMLFDNGTYFRNFNWNQDVYSRAVEYEINETDQTVKQIWQYGKERGISTFSEIVSDVDFDPSGNHVIFSPGFEVRENGEVTGGRIVEIDYDTKQVVFEALIRSEGITFHRTERINLEQ